nr:MAG TPA: Pituitary adenylate cyclase activating polypeptide-38-GROWTH FACTOR COMPLEX [Caudoviricetes sp.]
MFWWICIVLSEGVLAACGAKFLRWLLRQRKQKEEKHT